MHGYYYLYKVINYNFVEWIWQQRSNVLGSNAMPQSTDIKWLINLETPIETPPNGERESGVSDITGDVYISTVFDTVHEPGLT